MADEAPTPQPHFLDINYQKSMAFREVGCDGILGGPTPQGSFWLAFYTERFPIPRIVRHKLLEAGEDGFTLDPEDPGTPLEAKEGVIRNVEFGVYMRRETMRQLHDWLGRALQESEGEE